jgi:hypothetical protein
MKHGWRDADLMYHSNSLEEFGERAGFALCVSSCPQKRLIFFDVPYGISIRRDDSIRFRVAVAEPRFKSRPKLRHVCVLQKREVADKFIEITLPEYDGFVFGVVPGLRVSNFMVAEPFDAGACGFAKYSSCISVLLWCNGHTQDDMWQCNIGTHEQIDTLSFRMLEVTSFETMTEAVEVVGLTTHMYLPANLLFLVAVVSKRSFE